ncbi:hypothetical protein [Leptospira selangorensis]|uniref:hypothetical protein n=1 Tax=Leptospira selangorensis TaxID=2484982 RepID=UPI00143830A0|nr:hypothetical protein [Leptospira selangorensis]
MVAKKKPIKKAPKKVPKKKVTAKNQKKASNTVVPPAKILPSNTGVVADISDTLPPAA